MAIVVNCKTCKKEMANNLSRCPHCGASVSKSFWTLLAISAAILIAYVLLFDPTGAPDAPKAHYVVTQQNSTKLNDFLNTEEMKAAKAFLSVEREDTIAGENTLLNRILFDSSRRVSPQKIASTYASNEIAGDQAYLEKSLQISGVVDSINSDIGNNPFITFKTNDSWSSPQASFEKPNIQRIAALRKGDRVVLKCIGGGEVTGTPMLKECEFMDEYLESLQISNTEKFEEWLEKPKNFGKAQVSNFYASMVTLTVVMNETLTALPNSELIESYRNCTAPRNCHEIAVKITTNPKTKKIISDSMSQITTKSSTRVEKIAETLKEKGHTEFAQTLSKMAGILTKSPTAQ